MYKKITLRQRFLQTGLLMLLLSLLIGAGLSVTLLVLFSANTPLGEEFLYTLLRLLAGQLEGPGGMLPYIILGAILLCLAVAIVCVALTSRLTGRLSATLKTLRQAADNLRVGDLNFEILSCPERELDELCQSLESVRRQMKEAAAKQARAQQERGLLMANLSHDLRTPITVIKGYVEGIKDGIAATEEKRAHYLETIYNKTLSLEQLVGDMRDFSEYELGRMQYQFETVDLTAFLLDLSEEYRLELEGAGMGFRAQLPDRRVPVLADPRKLKRVLDNLISNAVKYGRPEGGVVLSAQRYQGGVIVQLSDNGKGISPQAMEHIFDSFYREDTARSSKVPGSGLGLAICKSILESHRGKIWLTSREGEGTDAFLYLPLTKEAV